MQRKSRDTEPMVSGDIKRPANKSEILKERTGEALDIWMGIFDQCLDRGDRQGIKEVDEHFGLIVGIKGVF